MMRLLPVSLAVLAVSMFIGASTAEVAVAQRFNPKNRGLPGRRQGGGTRGACNATQGAAIALMPIDNFGTTIAERPTLSWFLPKTQPTNLMVVLLDDQGKEIYSGEVPVTGKSGLVSFTLPAEVTGLEIGKIYNWKAALVCEEEDLSSSMVTEGWIHRVAVSPELQQKLQQTPIAQHSTIYETAGLWYDMADSMVQLHRSQPQNPTVQQQWNIFLESVDLKTMMQPQLADVKAAPDMAKK
jgi:hypothetical protein